MDLTNKYPSIWHLARRAEKQIPFFAWEYLDSGTGMECLVDRNRERLDAVHITPRVLGGRFTPDLCTKLFGQEYSVPFGASPIGMSSLMWPGAERILARTAQTKNMPYSLSVVANENPETIASIAPKNTWMQIFCPRDPDVLADFLARSKASGIKTLIITVDTPVGSSRERLLAAGITVPPKLDALKLWQVALHPKWAISTLMHGSPRFKTLEPYFNQDQMHESASQVGTILDGRPDWDSITSIRRQWDGNLIIKGIMAPEDAEIAISHGADAVWVSNHGARQFDGAPAAIDALPRIAEKVSGRVPILFDSGIRGGLDIIRALSLGADFCFLGRAFLYSIAALGNAGGNRAYDILQKDLENNMIQIGARSISDIRNLNN